jgi:hypothetical protein
MAPEAHAWERGLNSGSWTKGAMLNVFVDDIPADAPAGTSAAIDEAIKEWNDAQAPFGGLKLVRAGATKANADIHISWGKNLAEWGTTAQKDNTDKNNNGFTKDTVRMKIETADGINARGITRILKHELGHAEGLGHSAASALMKGDAYSSTAGKAPSAADLNSANPFTAPTDDDKAGKKTLWGTVEKLSKSDASASATFSGGKWDYQYFLKALNSPGLTDPVTRFTLDLPLNLKAADLTVTGLPNGWSSSFLDGFVAPGKGFNDGDVPSPSLLSFSASSLSFGIQPGAMAEFEITSMFGPSSDRGFTNSPHFDSDEFALLAPAMPEPASWVLLALGAAVLGACRPWRRRHPQEA